MKSVKRRDVEMKQYSFERIHRELAGRSFVSTNALSDEAFNDLIELALQQKRGDLPYSTALADKTVALMFFSPSLRTRASMVTAVNQLGGFPLVMDIGEGVWQIEFEDHVVMKDDKAEHIREAAPVMASYADIIGIRAFPRLKDYAADKQDAVMRKFMEHSPAPIVNLESSLYHPCQALADMMTIKELTPRSIRPRVVLTWANHPKMLPNAVPNSFALASCQCGYDFVLAAPPEYQLDDEIMNFCRAAALRNGGSLTLTHDMDKAMEGADFVYAKSWASVMHYGDSDKERQLRAEYASWIVNEKRMAATRGGKFMHCLPVRRNIVVTDGVLDGPDSIVVQQAANRLYGQKTLLSVMAEGLREERPRPLGEPAATAPAGRF
jgi:N-acetylornithine carbamoyltransferase